MFSSPVTRVTLRYGAAADRGRIRELAELESTPAPVGPTLVAEIDGRLLAALPLDGGAPLAERSDRGAGLVDLLQLRATQLP